MGSSQYVIMFRCRAAMGRAFKLLCQQSVFSWKQMSDQRGSHTIALQAAGAPAAAEGGPDSRRMAAGLQNFVQQICGMYGSGFSSQRMLLQQSLASSQVGFKVWIPPLGHLALLSGHRLLLLSAVSPSSCSSSLGLMSRCLGSYADCLNQNA